MIQHEHHAVGELAWSRTVMDLVLDEVFDDWLEAGDHWLERNVLPGRSTVFPRSGEVRSAGPWAGRFEGVDAVANIVAEYLEFLGGTFTNEVGDVCVSGDRSMSFVVERGSEDGLRYENRVVWTNRFVAG